MYVELLFPIRVEVLFLSLVICKSSEVLTGKKFVSILILIFAACGERSFGVK